MSDSKAIVREFDMDISRMITLLESVAMKKDVDGLQIDVAISLLIDAGRCLRAAIKRIE